MRRLTGAVAAFCLSALFGVASPNARADEGNKKTLVTFNQPVEIPGRVLLAGTYVFNLEDTAAGDRYIVQIWTGDDMHLIATIIATPTERPESANESAFTFEKRRPGSPEALKTWFYSGDTDGVEFEYPNP
ncbi:MAG: hypothetical protein WCE53_18395 [Candidatus Acidiferrum sp.]